MARIFLDRDEQLWHGLIEAPATGTFTFYMQSDDGMRLWVGDLSKPLIDNFVSGGATEKSGSISLQAGHFYRVLEARWLQLSVSAAFREIAFLVARHPAAQRGYWLLTGPRALPARAVKKAATFARKSKKTSTEIVLAHRLQLILA